MLRRVIFRAGLALTVSAATALFSKNAALSLSPDTMTPETRTAEVKWEVEYLDGNDQPYTPGGASLSPNNGSQPNAWFKKVSAQSGPKQPTRSSNPPHGTKSWSSKPSGG
jgi:hypothetical protein